MANYHEMTTYELEQEYSSLADKLMECSDDEQVERIAEELDLIQDELDSREEDEETY